MKINKENKCRQCNRYIPEHIRFIKCSDKVLSCKMLKYFYQIFSNSLWKQIKMDMQQMYSNVSAIYKYWRRQFQTNAQCIRLRTDKGSVRHLAPFKTRTLLDKIPKQNISFDDLYHNGNSSTYCCIPKFTDKNFDDKTSFGTLHTNIASLQNATMLFVPCLTTSIKTSNLLASLKMILGNFSPMHQSLCPISQYTKQKPQLLKVVRHYMF